MNGDTTTWRGAVSGLRDQINALYPEWTDHNLHDPGITLLELFAWLFQNQQYQSGRISGDHRKKYLKLLGITPGERGPSHTFVAVAGREPVRIPAGTRFYAGDICFETRREQMAVEGIFREFVSCFGEQRSVLGGDWLREGRGIAVYPFTHEPKAGYSLEIGLLAPLEAGVSHRLYMEFRQDYPVKRKRIDEAAYDGHGFYPLAEIRLQYMTEAGWAAATVEKDGTWGFLENGSLVFRLDSPMDRGNCRLRFVLERSDYILAPCINRMSLSMVKVWQLETLGAEALARFHGTGFPGQRYDLEETGIYRKGFGLQAESPETPGQMETWELVGDFDCSGPEDRHFRLEEGVLEFGDGIHGMMPEGRIQVTHMERTLGDQGNIKSGTINWTDLPGQLQLYHEQDAEGGCREETVAEALGRFRDGGQDGTGRPEGEVQQYGVLWQEGAVRKDEIGRPERAVRKDVAGQSDGTGQPAGTARQRALSLQDYEELILNIPGLLIEDCRGFCLDPGSKEVVLAVKPYSERGRGVLNKAYERNLYRYLEEKRMIGTRLKLVPPDYYDVTIVCTVSARVEFQQARQLVEAALRDWVRSRGFGQGIVYGDLLGMLDAQPCVLQAESLWLDAGGRGKRSPGGDLLIPPWGLLWLKRVVCNLTAPSV